MAESTESEQRNRFTFLYSSCVHHASGVQGRSSYSDLQTSLLCVDAALTSAEHLISHVTAGHMHVDQGLRGERIVSSNPFSGNGLVLIDTSFQCVTTDKASTCPAATLHTGFITK